MKCAKCEGSLRPKENSDWAKGEKIGKGFRKDSDYFICIKCKKGYERRNLWQVNKDEKVTGTF